MHTVKSQVSLLPYMGDRHLLLHTRSSLETTSSAEETQVYYFFFFAFNVQNVYLLLSVHSLSAFELDMIRRKKTFKGVYTDVASTLTAQ